MPDRDFYLFPFSKQLLCQEINQLNQQCVRNLMSKMQIFPIPVGNIDRQGATVSVCHWVKSADMNEAPLD